jgi:hypothetical protein
MRVQYRLRTDGVAPGQRTVNSRSPVFYALRQELDRAEYPLPTGDVDVD